MRNRRLHRPREAGPILIEGLSGSSTAATTRPESRWSTTAADLFVEKRAGKLANLQTAIADRTPHAAIGLAHTRWATHGRPERPERPPAPGLHRRDHGHPQRDHRELPGAPRRAEERGHTLASETDTEAIAHLIEEAYDGDLADAVRAALRQLEGAYALAVMHRGEPDRLVGARKNVPLVVGLADGEIFLASDVAAILAHTDRVDLPRGGRRRRPPAGGVDDHRRRRRARRAGRDDHRLVARGRREGRLRPFHAQGDPRTACGAPPAIAGRVSHDGRDRASTSSGLADRLARSDRVEFVACGTAYYAALVGAAAIQDWTGLPARATVGSEFRYCPPPLDGRDARHRRDPVGRDGRHDRPDPLRPERGCPDHRGDEHGRLGDHPRGRRGPLPAGRARDRRRRDEDVRDPGDDPGDPCRGDRQARGTLLRRRELDARRRPAGTARRGPAGARPQRAASAELARRYVNSRGFMFVGRGLAYPARSRAR